MTLSNADYEKFNLFIFSIDDSIEDVLRQAEKYKIDLSTEKNFLDNLEKLILNEGVKSENDNRINIYAQFLGEYFIRKYGGNWKLSDDEQDKTRYNFPVISGHSGSPVDFDPIDKIRKFTRQRRQGLLERSINSYISPIELQIIEEK